jgi:hypothetical protein
MSDQKEDLVEYDISINIAETNVHVGCIFMEADVKAFRDFAEGKSDRVIYAEEDYVSINTEIVVRGDTAKIQLSTDYCFMSTKFPAVLVRAEIARCLELAI